MGSSFVLIINFCAITFHCILAVEIEKYEKMQNIQMCQSSTIAKKLGDYALFDTIELRVQNRFSAVEFVPDFT